METITVYYTGKAWNLAIKAELRRRRLRRGKVKIIAIPKETNERFDKIENNYKSKFAGGRARAVKRALPASEHVTPVKIQSRWSGGKKRYRMRS